MIREGPVLVWSVEARSDPVFSVRVHRQVKRWMKHHREKISPPHKAHGHACLDLPSNNMHFLRPVLFCNSCLMEVANTASGHARCCLIRDCGVSLH